MLLLLFSWDPSECVSYIHQLLIILLLNDFQIYNYYYYYFYSRFFLTHFRSNFVFFFFFFNFLINFFGVSDSVLREARIRKKKKTNKFKIFFSHRSFFQSEEFTYFYISKKNLRKTNKNLQSFFYIWMISFYYYYFLFFLLINVSILSFISFLFCSRTN